MDLEEDQPKIPVQRVNVLSHPIFAKPNHKNLKTWDGNNKSRKKTPAKNEMTQKMLVETLPGMAVPPPFESWDWSVHASRGAATGGTVCFRLRSPASWAEATGGHGTCRITGCFLM